MLNIRKIISQRSKTDSCSTIGGYKENTTQQSSKAVHCIMHLVCFVVLSIFTAGLDLFAISPMSLFHWGICLVVILSPPLDGDFERGTSQCLFTTCHYVENKFVRTRKRPHFGGTVITLWTLTCSLQRWACIKGRRYQTQGSNQALYGPFG